VVGLGLGQDQLGYIYPPFLYPFTNGVAPYPSDHLIYNVSATLADELANAQVSNLHRLGFKTAPVAIERPEHNNYQQGFHPGVQALASPARGDAGAGGTFATALEGIFGGNSIPGNLGFGLQPGLAGKIQWDLGDGNHFASDDGGRFNHAYPPGRYVVKLAAKDTSGDQASWYVEVIVHPHLTAGYTAARRSRYGYLFSGSASGGDGTILAWRWIFSDGTTANGPQVAHTFPRGVRHGAKLTVTDATGATASALRPAPACR
jgi:hypothetical protein